MSPEVAEAQSEIRGAEQDLKQDAHLIGEKARIELTPAEILRRHPLTVIALVSFAAYVMYRVATGRRQSPTDENFAQRE